MELLLLELLGIAGQWRGPTVDALPASGAADQEVLSSLDAGIARIEANREADMRRAKGLLQVQSRALTGAPSLPRDGVGTARAVAVRVGAVVDDLHAVRGADGRIRVFEGVAYHAEIGPVGIRATEVFTEIGRADRGVRFQELALRCPGRDLAVDAGVHGEAFIA